MDNDARKIIIKWISLNFKILVQLLLSGLNKGTLKDNIVYYCMQI